MQRILKNWIAALGTASLLVACGGGGGDSPAATATAPPPTTNASVAQTAAKMQDMSTFMAAVKYVDDSSLEQLMPAMENPGNMTVFAPSNEAFDKLAVELMGPGKKGTDLLNEDMKDDVRDILKNHMLMAKVLLADMSFGKAISTSLGSGATITITIANGVVTISDGQGGTAVIKLSDILANNGVLHLIDRIIKPPKEMVKKKSIVDIAAKTPALSSLVAALGFASNNGDLVTLLGNTGTFTVFAPTNQAFDDLAVELLGAGKKAADLLVPANKDLVRAVLQYHVLGSVVKKSAIPLGKPINPVLAGNDIFKIDKVKAKDDDDDSKLVITDGRNRKSDIIATNIKASNGIVHVIDKVILPADKDIVQTAIAAAPEFSILVEAVVAAGLADALKAPGPLTVFAPTNAAFADLLAELKLTKAALLANKALLTTVLTYHVVPGLVLKAEVPVGKHITTLQGDTFTVDAKFKITDQAGRTSSIVATDILAKNGVIHVIDKVILPTLH